MARDRDAERDSGGDGPERPGQQARQTADRDVPFTQQIGRITLIVLAVLFGVFAVVNAQFVDFNWIFGSTEVQTRGGERVGGGVPLIVLLVLSFALGVAVGALLVRRGTRRRVRAGAAGERGDGPADETRA